MAAISRYKVEQYVTKIFKEYLGALKEAKRNKKKLLPEANILFEGMDEFAGFINSNNLQQKVYNRLNLEGIKELFNEAKLLALYYDLPSYTMIKNADVIENTMTFSPTEHFSSPDTWKIYLNTNKKISKVEYGTDKTKAQIINSDGMIGAVIEMEGTDYEGKGFAKKLLTAAKLETTEAANLELQNTMLDDGLFYINKEEGWVTKESYFARMTAKDFLSIQDYKDITVKAVYDDSKGELTFTYTVGGKTENLFVIKASNNQKERQWPTKSGNNVFPSEATTSAEKKKIEMKTMPDDGTTPVDYIPEKFPKGNWKIIAFEKNGEKEYGPYKIRTDAWREVEAWEEYLDTKVYKKKWRKKTDKNGKTIKTRDSGLLIHGGGWSESSLDNQKGSNKYTDTTLGCIRINNLDVLLIVKVLQAYLNEKNYIELEVK